MTTPAFHELADILDFTGADLAANREGFITERQVKGLRIKHLGMSISLFIEFLFAMGLAAFLLITLFIWLNSPFRNLADLLGFLVFLAVTGSLVAIVSYHLLILRRRRWLAYGQDLKAGIVKCVKGQLIKTARKNRNSWWTIRISGEELPINQKIFPYFEHGTSYHIYFTPHTRIILSVEFVQDTV